MIATFLANKVVDFLFRGQAFTPPATLYVALMTTTGTDGASGVEVVGGSYTRVAVTSTLANWSGTQAPGSTVASTGTSATTSNNNAITFPSPTANWGSITSVEFYDAVTAGNRWCWMALTVPKTVNNGDPAPVFNPATLSVQVDNT